MFEHEYVVGLISTTKPKVPNRFDPSDPNFVRAPAPAKKMNKVETAFLNFEQKKTALYLDDVERAAAEREREKRKRREEKEEDAAAAHKNNRNIKKVSRLKERMEANSNSTMENQMKGFQGGTHRSVIVPVTHRAVDQTSERAAASFPKSKKQRTSLEFKSVETKTIRTPVQTISRSSIKPLVTEPSRRSPRASIQPESVVINLVGSDSPKKRKLGSFVHFGPIGDTVRIGTLRSKLKNKGIQNVQGERWDVTLHSGREFALTFSDVYCLKVFRGLATPFRATVAFQTREKLPVQFTQGYYDPSHPSDLKSRYVTMELDLDNTVVNSAFESLLESLGPKCERVGSPSEFGEEVQKQTKDPSGIVLIYPSPRDLNAITITNSDIEHLNPGEFLNDAIIEFGLRHMKAQDDIDTPIRKQIGPIPESIRSDMHVFSTFFYSQYTSDAKGFDKVKNWNKRVSIFEKRFLIFPINESLHWSLVIVFNPRKLVHNSGEPPSDLTPGVLFLDSLGSKSKKHLKNVRRYLKEIWDYKGGNGAIDVTSSHQADICLNLPKQKNYFDCGVYLVMYVMVFLKRLVSRDSTDFESIDDIKKHFRGMVAGESVGPLRADQFRDDIRDSIKMLAKEHR